MQMEWIIKLNIDFSKHSVTILMYLLIETGSHWLLQLRICMENCDLSEAI